MGDETLREVAELLFGDGASDLISKAVDAEKERKARGLTAGLSAVGAAAGTAGLAYAARDVREARRLGQAVPMRTKALIPLEVAGLGGEVLATKFLHADSKKKKGLKPVTVKKSSPDQADLHIEGSIGVIKPNPQKKKVLTPQQIKGKMIKQLARKTEPKAKELGTQAVKEATFTDDRYVKKETPSITWEGEISKVNEERRQVFGWASVVERDGLPVSDLQGDYIDIHEIEKSAYDYVVKSRKGGNQHQRAGEEPLHVSDLIESLIVTPEKKAVLGLPEETPLGWWVGFKVNDDQTWDDFKTGRRTQFSIHGRGRREVVA